MGTPSPASTTSPNGHYAAVDKRAKFYVGDLANTFQIIDIFQKEKIEAVMHFAAFAYVGESVTDPGKYYRNNVSNTRQRMLRRHARHRHQKTRLLLDLQATYGMPPRMPITEDLPQNPINPYGDSKLMVEHILKDTAKAEGLAFAAPRYFNVAGSALDVAMYRRRPYRPETHIIPILPERRPRKKSHMDLYGTDYPTKDGTPVRDYIRRLGLSSKPTIVLLENLKPSRGLFYNLGVGRGLPPTAEIIEAVEKVTGKKSPSKKPRAAPAIPRTLRRFPAKIKKNSS